MTFREAIRKALAEDPTLRDYHAGGVFPGPFHPVGPGATGLGTTFYSVLGDRRKSRLRGWSNISQATLRIENVSEEPSVVDAMQAATDQLFEGIAPAPFDLFGVDVLSIAQDESADFAKEVKFPLGAPVEDSDGGESVAATILYFARSDYAVRYRVPHDLPDPTVGTGPVLGPVGSSGSPWSVASAADYEGPFDAGGWDLGGWDPPGYE